MFDQLKNLKSLASMFGNMDEIKAKFEQFQQDLARRTVEGDAGAGAVRVVMNGKFEVLEVRIDPAMMAALSGDGNEQDRAMVEDLIAAAFNATLAKAQELVRGEMSRVTGGLNLPLPGLGG